MLLSRLRSIRPRFSKLSAAALHDLAQTQASLNQIMLQEAAAAFPARPGPDARVSADPRFRATPHLAALSSSKKAGRLHSARHLVQVAAPYGLARASKQLRQQSKSLKREFLYNLVDTADVRLSAP